MSFSQATGSCNNSGGGPYTTTGPIGSVGAGHTIVALNLSVSIQTTAGGTASLKFGLHDANAVGGAGDLLADYNLSVAASSSYNQCFYIPYLGYNSLGQMQAYQSTASTTISFANVQCQIYYI